MNRGTRARHVHSRWQQLTIRSGLKGAVHCLARSAAIGQTGCEARRGEFVGKKIIVPIVLVAGAFLLQQHRAQLTEPGTITNPVYGETRLSIGRSLDSLDIVMLTKAADA